MGKIVVLSFTAGDCQQGFQHVSLEIKEDNHRPLKKIDGNLPSAPQIPQLYNTWQSKYRQMGSRVRIEPKSGQVTNYSSCDLEADSDALRQQLNDWLTSPGFSQAINFLGRIVSRNEEVRVIIQTEDLNLRRLPWHLWEFFDYYQKAQVALSSTAYQQIDSHRNRNQVRVLAIIGDSTGINLERDKRELERNLPNAEIVFLMQPERREVYDAIWDAGGWDILFFAGHSLSASDATTGKLFIKQGESLEVKDMKAALRKAIGRGLKLAIFNSCDGLGIAKQLAELNIAQVIVMREPVPDVVAQEFLKRFLEAFARGESLYLAVREARERLEIVQGEFPCATWLPVLCQNPAEEPMSWQELCGVQSNMWKGHNYQQKKSNDSLNIPLTAVTVQESRLHDSSFNTDKSKQLSNQAIDEDYSIREQQIAEYLTARNLSGLFELLLELKGLCLNQEHTLRWLYAVGGQSIVYLAESSSGKMIIIKIAFLPYHRPAYVSTEAIRQARKCLEREGSLLHKLQDSRLPKFNHLIYAPNPLHSSARGDEVFNGEPYLVMEFIRGRNLLEIARKAHQQTQTDYEALEVLAWEVTTAVTDFSINIATGTEPYLYSDFNPRNLMLTDNLNQPVRILDAGSLIPICYDTTVSLPFTEAYVPPEYYEAFDKGETLWPTPGYVMYTFGKTLWEVLTNRQPYPAEDPDMSVPILKNYSHHLQDLVLSLFLRRYISFEQLKQAIESTSGCKRFLKSQLTAFFNGKK